MPGKPGPWPGWWPINCRNKRNLERWVGECLARPGGCIVGWAPGNKGWQISTPTCRCPKLTSNVHPSQFRQSPGADRHQPFFITNRDAFPGKGGTRLGRASRLSGSCANLPLPFFWRRSRSNSGQSGRRKGTRCRGGFSLIVKFYSKKT